MENRKPFDMQWLLVLYNGYQVLFSAWLCAQVRVVQLFSDFKYKFEESSFRLESVIEPPAISGFKNVVLLVSTNFMC